MKWLRVLLVFIISIFISQVFAQSANLVLENMTISDTENFQATNSIIFGSEVTITNTGNVTLNAPIVNFRNNVYIIDGGSLLVLSPTAAVNVKSETNLLPSEFCLMQNYPNPFNPTTTIKFSVSKTSNVIIKIYDILGSEMLTLVNEELQAGWYHKTFNASSYSSGIYLFRMKADNYVSTRKMILLK